MAQGRGDLSRALRHSITPWISPQLTSESDLDSTSSARASREYSSSKPTKMRYCLIGNSKRHKRLATQPVRSIRCFSTTIQKTTLWEWTWLANFCRWVTRDHEGTPIINQAGSTREKAKSYCLEDEDHEKAQSAHIFYQIWQKARADKRCLQLRNQHRKLYENTGS